MGNDLDKEIMIDISRINGDLKMSSKMGDLRGELEKRLAGIKDDDKMDDQLLMEAARMEKDEYAVEMWVALRLTEHIILDLHLKYTPIAKKLWRLTL